MLCHIGMILSLFVIVFIVTLVLFLLRVVKTSKVSANGALRW